MEEVEGGGRFERVRYRKRGHLWETFPQEEGQLGVRGVYESACVDVEGQGRKGRRPRRDSMLLVGAVDVSWVCEQDRGESD